MLDFNPDNSIYTLTKYISPREIENEKRKRIINSQRNEIEQELAGFDEFFRDDELFDDSTDFAGDYFEKMQYDPDDIPAITGNSRKNRDLTHLNTANHINPLSSNLPPHVLRVKNGEKLYLETLMDALDTEFDYRESINSKLDKGYDISDIINILDMSFSGEHITDEKVNMGFKLLNEKYPLEYINYLLDNSMLTNAKGEKYYPKGMLHFLKDYPDYKDYIVSKNYLSDEIIDYNAVAEFPHLHDICDNDTDLYNIIKACRTYNGAGDKVLDRQLVKLAKEIYLKNKQWTQDDTGLIRDFATKYDFSLLHRQVQTMVDAGFTSAEIRNVLKSSPENEVIRDSKFDFRI